MPEEKKIVKKKESKPKGDKVTFWDRIKVAFKAGMNEVLIWLQIFLVPELGKFLVDNKDVCIEFVTEAASYYATEPGHLKFESVGKRMRKHLITNADNLKVRNHWIDLLIMIVVTVLKNTGKIK